MVWEVLNASTSASTSASERHLWEQNHRKRKRPAGGSLVSGCMAGAAGPTQDPGTSLAQVTWASQRHTILRLPYCWWPEGTEHGSWRTQSPRANWKVTCYLWAV